MTLLALALVLLAACLHATWNLAAKSAGGGLPFVFTCGLVINLLYLPVVTAFWIWRQPVLPWSALAVIAVSATLKTGYSLFLQRAYRAGDFSLVYPLARGTGPLVALLGATLLLGEHPSLQSTAGAILIVAGIFFLTGGAGWFRAGLGAIGPGLRYGLVTGVFIASYTLWDRHAVAARHIPPVLFDAGTALVMTTLLAPFAWRRRPEVTREWREHRPQVLVMAFLSPLGYVLVLTALSFTPVSYVAPAREISILIGTYAGARFLKETRAPARLWPAAAMVTGLVLLATG